MKGGNKMDCKIFEVLIHDYIDQRDMLSKDEIIEIEKHLNECETCKNYYIEMKKIMSIIKEDSQIDLEFPDDLHESIMNEVKKEYKKPLRINKWIPIIGSCAAVFLIAMVVKIGSGDKSYNLKESFTENTVMEYTEEAEADMILMDKERLYPVEFKSTAKVHDNVRIQIEAYAWLGERKFKRSSKGGFLVSTDKNKTIPVKFGASWREKLESKIETALHILSHQNMPTTNASLSKCVQCEYLQRCNDRI